MLRRDTSRSYQEVVKPMCEMRLDPAGLISSGFPLAIVVTQKVHNNCSHVIPADRSSLVHKSETLSYIAIHSFCVYLYMSMHF